ncbi:MAG: hypothetical protein JWO08_1371 [Verrucomicrobiaceae bacterium]|nr:hypothetical protein [Verrucomicrobiaceae bacterium]
MISEHASPMAAVGHVDSGGQNVYVAHLARQLADEGHQIDVFTRRDSMDQAEVVAWHPRIRVIHVTAGPPCFVRKEELLDHMPAFTSFVYNFMLRDRVHYDLVHANFWTSGLVALQLKELLNIPYVITFHALGAVRRMHQKEQDGFPASREEIERRVGEGADLVIAECPQDCEDLTRLYGVDAARIAMIPCGFDPEEIWPVTKAAARAQLGIGAEEKVVLQLGRMVPRKGVETAIQGVAHLHKNHGLRTRLVVVGGEIEGDSCDAAEVARLSVIANKEGLREHVSFVGRKDRHELKYYYSAADVFITLPWYEPFGITPLEAMACRLPVVGSNVGGIRHTVRHGISGLLVPPKNPALAGEALASLFNEPSLLQKYGQEGFRRVHQHFTWRAVSDRMAKAYERVIGGRAAMLQASRRNSRNFAKTYDRVSVH